MPFLGDMLVPWRVTPLRGVIITTMTITRLFSVISGPILSSSEDLDVSDAHPVHAVVKPNHGNTSEINHKYIYQHLPVGVPIEPYPG